MTRKNSIFDNMKKFIQKLKKYFVRLYAAIRGKEIEVIKVKKIYGQKRKDLDDFDLEHIKKLMDMTNITLSSDEESVQELFIKNRKKYNEYKKWYWELVGFNKPPEELKKAIDADLKLDRSEMNKLMLEIESKYQSDNDIKNGKNDVSEIPTEIGEALINGEKLTPEMQKFFDALDEKEKKTYEDFEALLDVNKVNLDRIKLK